LVNFKLLYITSVNGITDALQSNPCDIPTTTPITAISK